MSKTLVVGDTHLKHEIILPRIKVAMEHHGADRIVFLGDYCDEWRANDQQFLSALELFSAWVCRTRESGLTVDLLLGNHDFEYVLGEEGPGTHIHLVREVCDLLLPLEPRMAATVDGFLITHAGLTQAWADRFLDSPKEAESARDELNAMYDQGLLRELFTCGPGRGGRDLPGPLWADLEELWADAVPDFGQIVGHTPVRTCGRMESAIASAHGRDTYLCCCDTFSLTSALHPVGDASMLLVEDGEIGVVGYGDGIEVPFWEDAVEGWSR